MRLREEDFSVLTSADNDPTKNEGHRGSGSTGAGGRMKDDEHFTVQTSFSQEMTNDQYVPMPIGGTE
eukprot:9351627-Pyramimonas_sp.AAC.1